MNVSPASTIDPDWWAGFASLLRANAGVAERLIVEITETAGLEEMFLELTADTQREGAAA